MEKARKTSLCISGAIWLLILNQVENLVLAAFSLPWFLRSFPLTLPLESDDVAFEEDFPCRDALTPEFSRVDQEVDVLAGDLEVSHGITHAHEVGEFMHSVTGLTSYAIADVVL